jgi:hypothetical protein
MSEVNEIFVPNSLSEEFVIAIDNCIKNPYTLNSCRNCRSLIMHKAVIDNFLLGNIDGCAPITAKGGGWIEWFLCRYKSNLYFVFLGTNSGEKTISARSTNLNEIILHLKNVDNGGGVNIDGDIIPYDQVYFSDEDLDGGELDFKTSMARPIQSRI